MLATNQKLLFSVRFTVIPVYSEIKLDLRGHQQNNLHTTKLSENKTRDNKQGISGNLWQTIITYLQIMISIANRTEYSGRNMSLK